MHDSSLFNGKDALEPCSRRRFLQNAARAAVLAGLGALSSFWVLRRTQGASDCPYPAISDCRQCRSFRDCPLSQSVRPESVRAKSDEASAF